MKVSAFHLLRVSEVQTHPQSQRTHAGGLETIFLVAPFPFSRFVKDCQRLFDNLDHGPQYESRPVAGRSPEQQELGIVCFSWSGKRRWQPMSLCKLRSSFPSFAALTSGSSNVWQRCSALRRDMPYHMCLNNALAGHNKGQ